MFMQCQFTRCQITVRPFYILYSKTSEVEALKARNKELEDIQMRQEDTINALKRQSKKICVS